MSKKIVILGAGLTGLSTAYHLENGCYIYEQNDYVGGLAASFKKSGFVFDCDGHLLHFKTDYARRLVHRLLPRILTVHKRNAWIFSHNTYTKYPFQANTYGLPNSVVKNCILGMLNNRKKITAGKKSNLKDWMFEKFGFGITNHFMYPYNLKFWTIRPEKLIPDWAEKYVPLVRRKEVVNGAFSLKTKEFGYNSRFWYPKQGGIEQLPQALSKHIRNIKLGHKICAVDMEKNKVFFKNGKSANYRHLVSTIPLIELNELIVNKLPADIKRAFSRLKYISIFNCNLGINRKMVSDKHWIYFPEDKYCFFRVGFATNFSKYVAPAGTSSLYAELSYSDSKPLPDCDVAQKIYTDLIAAGILKPEDKILTTHINDIKYGYVIYDKNYHISVKTIKDYLYKYNIYPAGRFGAWRYMSMEDAMLEGKRLSGFLK
ncbi:MAG: FAD-dependent oxidoreductase [Candidatus Omnitrophica bacterium]|nr:FAD-dependent oxidoreductase [Candidatus Omnitrophota bacterium]MBU1925378.1 FAD-dependent oxidoreductase [Candidatus Omnitrophota bacterium]